MTGRRTQQRGVAMERLTVQNTSYRPIPVSARCRPPRTAPAQRHVSFGTVTVYREAYRSRSAAAVGPTRSSAPRDHAFLAGDRTSRFCDTSYQTDYSAPKARVPSSSQKRDRPPDVRARRPLVPVQTETTTGRAFRRPAMPALWRRPPSVYKGSDSPAETLTVHRASYRPYKVDPQPAAVARVTCIGCAGQGNAAKPRRAVGVPVESQTTYAIHYGGGARHERPGRDDSPAPESCPSLGRRPSEMSRMRKRKTTTTDAVAAPRAHDYTV